MFSLTLLKICYIQIVIVEMVCTGAIENKSDMSAKSQKYVPKILNLISKTIDGLIVIPPTDSESNSEESREKSHERDYLETAPKFRAHEQPISDEKPEGKFVISVDDLVNILQKKIADESHESKTRRHKLAKRYRIENGQQVKQLRSINTNNFIDQQHNREPRIQYTQNNDYPEPENVPAPQFEKPISNSDLFETITLQTKDSYEDNVVPAKDDDVYETDEETEKIQEEQQQHNQFIGGTLGNEAGDDERLDTDNESEQRNKRKLKQKKVQSTEETIAVETKDKLIPRPNAKQNTNKKNKSVKKKKIQKFNLDTVNNNDNKRPKKEGKQPSGKKQLKKEQLNEEGGQESTNNEKTDYDYDELPKRHKQEYEENNTPVKQNEGNYDENDKEATENEDEGHAEYDKLVNKNEQGNTMNHPELAQKPVKKLKQRKKNPRKPQITNGQKSKKTSLKVRKGRYQPTEYTEPTDVYEDDDPQSSKRTTLGYGGMDTVNMGDDSEEEDEDASPKLKQTLIPTRDIYKMSTPDYYNKQPKIVEKQNVDEPLPEVDRIPEDTKKWKKRPHGMVNGKKISRKDS